MAILNLLIRTVAEQPRNQGFQRYICNLMTCSGETEGFSIMNTEGIASVMGMPPIDRIAPRRFPPHIPKIQLQGGAEPLYLDSGRGPKWKIRGVP